MKILLDAHMPLALATQLRRQGIDVVGLSEWLGGEHRTEKDVVILLAARADGRLLITYDCRTIPGLLTELADAGERHAGVVLVDVQTIRSRDVGGLVRAIRRLVLERGDEDWEDRVSYLERA